MNQSTSKSHTFKILQIIYTAFIFGVLALSVFIYFSLKNAIYQVNTDDIFTIVIPIIALSGIFMSTFVYKTMLSKIDTSDTLQAKITKYQTANIVKGALLEGPALLASVVVMLTNNLFFFVFTATMVLIMYLRFPTKVKFESEVPLTLEDKSELNRG